MYTAPLYLLFLSLLFIDIHVTADEESFLCTSSTQEHMVNNQKLAMQKDILIKIANDYLLFINDVGSLHSVKRNDPRLETLFAEDLTKIDNTSLLFEKNRDALLPQMRSFEVTKGSQTTIQLWTVDVHNALIIPSPETNTVAVNFEWVHAHAGKGTTVAILKCNTSGKIEQIKDVWALVKDTST